MAQLENLAGATHPDDSNATRCALKIVSWFDGFELRHGRLRLGMLVAIVCFAISLFLAFPIEIVNALRGHYDLSTLSDKTVNFRYVLSYLPEVTNPWHPDVPPDYIQFRHRILAPVIAHYLGIRGNASCLIPFLANLPLLGLAFLTMRTRATAVVSAMVTLMLSVTLVTVTGQAWAGFQDSLANLFLLAALFAYGPVISALMMLVGMFADERILAAVPLVLIWHGTDRRSSNWLREGFIRCVAFGVTFIVWVGYYLLLKRVQHVTMTDAANAAYSSPAKYVSAVLPAIYFALRAAWVFPILAVILAAVEKHWIKAGLLVAAVIPVLLISLLVGDISRVCAIAFPAVFIGVDWSSKSLRLQLAVITAVLTLANLASPILSITGGFTRYFNPAPLAILQMMKK